MRLQEAAAEARSRTACSARATRMLRLLGRERRRDRRARPARRLDSRARVGADLPAERLLRPRDDEGARRPGADAGTAADKNYPALNRALVGRYPPGSTFKPVTALAAMQEHLVSPYHAAAVHRLVHVSARQRAPGLPQLGPVRQPGHGPADGARAVVRHVLLPPRRRVLRAAAGARPPAAGAGRAASGSGADGDRRRPGGGGLLPTPDGGSEHFTTSASRPAVEARRLDPARDRPEGPARHADADGALLRADRERRQARDAAPCCSASRSRDDRRGRAAPAAPAAQQLGVDPAAIEVVREGLLRRRTRPSAPRRQSSAASRSPSRARPARRRRASIRVTGSPGKFDQSWWCGYGPYDNPSIVVCARDRERRPRRRRPRRRRAEGLRAVLQREGARRSAPIHSRLMASTTQDPRRPRPHEGAPRRARGRALVPAPARLGAGARRGGARRVRALGDRRRHAPRRRRATRTTSSSARRRSPRSAGSASRSRSRSTRTSAALLARRSTSARSR